MKSIFLVWKDKNCDGENPEWIHMNANEFFEFKKLPENAGRRFVRVGDKKSCPQDTVIFIEANKEIYRKSNAEHSEYMRKVNEMKKYPLKFISLDKPCGDDFSRDNHEKFSDNSREEEYILDKLQADELRKAIEGLTEKEKSTLEILMFALLRDMSEREAAEYFGIPQKTLNCRKQKIFEKLKKLFAQNG